MHPRGMSGCRSTRKAGAQCRRRHGAAWLTAADAVVRLAPANVAAVDGALPRINRVDPK